MPSSSRSRTPLVLGAVAVVVVLIAIVAVVAAGGDDDGTGDTSGTSATGGTGGTAPADAIDPLSATVTVTGDPLVLFEGDPDADPAVGTPAPGLRGTDYAGEATVVTPGEDGPMLLVFLAHWCPHCNDEIPVLNEWRDAGGVPEDLRIVGVSTAGSPDRPNYPPGEWLTEMDWQWEVLADGPFDGSAPPAALEAYGVSAYPFFTLIDADGNVAARGSGEPSIEELQALVARVAG